METYEELVVEVVTFDMEDVIVTSSTGSGNSSSHDEGDGVIITNP